jgi:hypothetical protein
MGGLRVFAASRERSCPPESEPRSLTGTPRYGEGGNNSLSGFLRASAPPREHPGLSGRNPCSLAETRRRGGIQGCRLQWFLRVSVRTFGFCPDQNPVLSRGHGESGSSFYRGFSAPLRLRENIGSFRTKPLFSRRDAEARRNSGLSASVVSPWLRENIRVLSRPEPGSLTETRGKRRQLLSGFLRASAAPREHSGLSRRNPCSLAETRRRGGIQGCRLQWFLRASVPP